jgi:hypothetical protein
MEIEPTLTPNVNFSDGVIREHGSGKLTLIGTFHVFNVPKFPFQPPPFFVTVSLSNFRGKLDHFKIAIRIEEKSSGYVVASAGGEIATQSEIKQTETVQIPFQLTGIFPSAGLYSVIVLAQGEPIGSRDLIVNPITTATQIPGT